MWGTEAAIHRGRGGFQVENGVLFQQSANTYLQRTFATGNRTTFTISVWVKQCILDKTYNSIFGPSHTSAIYDVYGFNNNKSRMFNWEGGASWTQESVGLHRDPSDWMHLQFVVDTNNAVSGDRLRTYIDGVRVETTGTNPSLGYNTRTNVGNISHRIGLGSQADRMFDGYMSEFAFLDGQAVDPEVFGEWNKNAPAVWQPRNLTDGHISWTGVNTFYLNFADPNDLGKDVSGNANSFSRVNITSADHSTDTPTNNVCTLNPLSNASVYTLTNGNRNVNAGTVEGRTHANFGMRTGKHYWEASPAQSINLYIGIAEAGLQTSYVGATRNSWGFTNGELRNNGGVVNNIPTYANGNRLMFCYDADAKKFWAGTQGVWYGGGDPANGTNPLASTWMLDEMFPALRARASNVRFYFNESEFLYTPPTGFNALMSKYIPEPTILDPKEYFAPFVYVGNGSAGRVIATPNKVDHLVIKNREATWGWRVQDSVRGNAKHLAWENTNAEYTELNEITSLGATSGFTLGSSSGVNQLDRGYLALPFTKTPAAGMDIVTYTGNGVVRQIPHNLGKKPAWILVKRLSPAGGGWVCYFDVPNMGPLKYCMLHDNTAPVADGNFWTANEPTASIFHVGTNANLNSNGQAYVAYLFANTPAFIKVQEYIGNGSVDGPFLPLDFKPALTIFKRTSAGGEWVEIDEARRSYNPREIHLHPDLTAAEGAAGYYLHDYLSNGIKLRNTNDQTNSNGRIYVNIAFASIPFGRRGL